MVSSFKKQFSCAKEAINRVKVLIFQAIKKSNRTEVAVRSSAINHFLCYKLLLTKEPDFFT